MLNDSTRAGIGKVGSSIPSLRRKQFSDDQLFDRAKSICPQTVLSRLGISIGKQHKFCCPAHDDKNPSADFMRKGKWSDAWLCRSCGAGGSVIDLVMHAMNLDKLESARWILDEPDKVISVDNSTLLDQKQAKGHETKDKLIASIRIKGFKQTQIYAYDESKYVVRLETSDSTKKDFRPIHKAKDGLWYIGKGDEKWPLYGTSREIKYKSAFIVIVEGEKAADAINNANTEFYAFTSQGGSSSPHTADWSTLPDIKQILIWPDNDGPGKTYADSVIQELDKANMRVGRTVKFVDTTGWADKWDAADELKDLNEPLIEKRLQEIWFKRSQQAPSPEEIQKDAALARLQESGFSAGNKIDYVETEFLMPGVMAKGEITLLVGAAGSGKTKVAYARAAKLTRGEPIDGIPVRGGPQKVAIISFEEDSKRVIVPTCIHSGMNMENVCIWEQPEGKPGIHSLESLCNILEDLASSGCSYVLIDSLTALYGRLGQDINDTKAPYLIHGEINRVARAKNICIELIHHYGKASGANQTDHQKAAGSYAIFASVRSVLQVEHDTTTGTRFLGVAPNKNNLGLQTKVLTFRTTRVVEHLNDGQGFIIAELRRWNETDNINDIAAMITKKVMDKQREQIKPVSVEVSEAIESYLNANENACLVTDIDDHLAKAGYSDNAIKSGKKRFQSVQMHNPKKWIITNIDKDDAIQIIKARIKASDEQPKSG